MKNNLKKRICPLCGKSGPMQLLFKGRFEVMDQDYRISECLNCSFIHQNPARPRHFYEKIYDTLVYDPIKISYPPEVTRRFKVVADLISSLPYNAKTPRLLDYGCYDGSFTEWLKNVHRVGKRMKLYGYDVALKDEAISNVSYFNDMGRTRKAGPFNIITLNHVLEHVYDPVKLLKTIRDSLMENAAYISIEVPDTSFVKKQDFSPTHIQHINYFTPETLTSALRRAGIAPILLRTFKNFDTQRDPCYPSMIMIGQKDPEYLSTGKSFLDRALVHREQLKKRFERLAHGTTMAVVGCGDPLSIVVSMLPKKIKLTGFYDNQKSLWGKKLYGFTIKPAASLADNSAKVVFVCTVHERKSDTIANALRKSGYKGRIMKVFDTTLTQ